MPRDRIHELDPTSPVTEQAAFWWVLLNEGNVSAADHRAFAGWVMRSPERVEAFLETARLNRALKSSELRWPETSVEELVRAAKASHRNVARLPLSGARIDAKEAPSEAAPHRGWLALAGITSIAAVALVALAIGLHFYLSPQRFETALGEQRSVVLGDGSIVTLNTSSSVEVRMERDHRWVTLLEGEALFQVAHDARRPFDVTAGETTVRAIGTQFNVDRGDAGTTVTVVEGKVAILTTILSNGLDTRGGDATRLPLEAGQQLVVSPRLVRHPVHADVATAIAWTQRKLVFDHRELDEVAREFNRYNRQAIEIQSDELRHQEVTGVFQANDPASFISFLARTPGIKIETSVDGARVVVSQENGG
jgi:transmembrane sensor